MTVNEAINLATQACSASVERDKLLKHLNGIEARIGRELLKTDIPVITEGDGERVLTAPSAYAGLYPAYLMMMRELECADSDRYSFYSEVFGAAYDRYAAWISRSSMLPCAALKLL